MGQSRVPQTGDKKNYTADIGPLRLQVLEKEQVNPSALDGACRCGRRAGAAGGRLTQTLSSAKARSVCGRKVNETVFHISGHEFDAHLGTHLELDPAAHQHAFSGR